MVSTNLSPLPIRVRPRHLETVNSYLVRLFEHNFLPLSALGSYRRQIGKLLMEAGIHPSIRPVEVALFLAIRLGSWRAENVKSWQYVWPLHPKLRVTLLVANSHRWMCRNCAHGEEVKQIDHLVGNVCATHRLWIGDGTSPERQTLVDDSVIRADFIFTRWIRGGRIRESAVDALWQILNDSQQSPEFETPICYVDLVKCLGILIDRQFTARLLDPRQTFHRAYELLEHEIVANSIEPHAPITDALWRYLRPTFWQIRSMLGGHAIHPAEEQLVVLPPATARPIGPLEPFHRYYAALRSSLANPLQDHFAKYAKNQVTNSPPLTEVLQDNELLDFICENGHVSSRDVRRIRESFESGHPGCGVCSGSSIDDEFNSLHQTHPALASQIDAGLNPGLDTRRIGKSDRRLIFWKCPEGHVYRMSVVRRVRGRSCITCTPTGWTIDHYPDVARQLDQRKNSEEFVGPVSYHPASSRIKLWWKCPTGHSYRARPTDRIYLHTGCPYCAHRKILVGFNDLTTTAPFLVPDWSPKNPDPPTTYMRASHHVAWWICAAGHADYARPIFYRTIDGSGCPTCPDRRLTVSDIRE
jgi:hypothetical protein